MSDFWEVFKAQAEARKDRRARRIIKKIESIRNAKRREKAIAWLERKSRSFMTGVGVRVAATWASVGKRDWDSFFDALSKFIAALLPILIQILPFLI